MSENDKLRQIEEGLAAIDYINRLRQSEPEKKTYGRSAIGLPKIRDRTQAWEMFNESVSQEARHEERGVQGNNEESRTGNRFSDGHDEDDNNSETGREFRESAWEDSDDIILENELVTYIPEHDKGRQTPNRKSDDKITNIINNQQRGNPESHGGSDTDEESMSVIFEGTGSETKYLSDEDQEEQLNELARWLEESAENYKALENEKITKPNPVNIKNKDKKEAQDNTPNTSNDPAQSTSKSEHDYTQKRPGTPIPKNVSDVVDKARNQDNDQQMDIDKHTEPKRLKAVAHKIITDQRKKQVEKCPVPKIRNSIKKGTEENISSAGMETKLVSSSGACQSVIEPQTRITTPDVYVGNALNSVMTQHVTESNSTSEQRDNDQNESVILGYDEYIDSIIESADDNDKFKMLYRNQLEILSKVEGMEFMFKQLDQLNTTIQILVNRIDNLDRSIGKIGLSNSLIEQMLQSMRIMVPGKPVNVVENEINPTLAPILGRPGQPINDIIDINLNNDIPNPYKLKNNLSLDPLDMSKTNASQFIAVCNPATKNAMYSLITNRIKDIDIRGAMLEKLESITTDDQIRDLHRLIKDAIASNL